MAEPGDILQSDDEPHSKPTPWGLIITVVLLAGLAILALWGMHEKKTNQAREAVVQVLDQELTQEQEAIKTQREKVLELTRRIETLRASIQTGEVKNGKAAVAEFNALAAEQRTERDKFAAMAEAYNKKVAKFKELSE